MGQRKVDFIREMKQIYGRTGAQPEWCDVSCWPGAGGDFSGIEGEDGGGNLRTGRDVFDVLQYV